LQTTTKNLKIQTYWKSLVIISQVDCEVRTQFSSIVVHYTARTFRLMYANQPDQITHRFLKLAVTQPQRLCMCSAP